MVFSDEGEGEDRAVSSEEVEEVVCDVVEGEDGDEGEEACEEESFDDGGDENF